MHSIWQTRPTRRQSDRKFAGVAAAIARRYDIDPVLIRIAFVVAAFYGIGIVLYLGAWIVLRPDPADPPTGSLFGRESAHPVLLVAAIVAALVGASSLFTGDPGVLVGLAVVGGLLYLLHQARSERGLTAEAAASLDDPARPAASAMAGLAAAPPGALSAGTRSAGESAQPPAWDPLGVAPFAWDLPDPSPQPSEPPARRRRPLVTLVTLALAVLGGVITASIAFPLAGPGGFRLVVGVMLAVVALGLLVGAFLHQGRGLLVAALPLMLAGWTSANAPLGPRWDGMGDLSAAPRSATELLPQYSLSIGSVTLDLRQLNAGAPGTPSTTTPPSRMTPPSPSTALTPPGSPRPAAPGPAVPAAPAVPGVPAAPGALDPEDAEPLRTSVNVEVGDVTVLLPPNMDVRVHCHTDLGSVDCLGNEGREERGPTADAVVEEVAAVRTPGAPRLELDINVGTGSVEVERD
ncbi:hypothetical protein GCM10023321_20010 [Pseudonocardia eucalypti]|uniref:Phage shock protein PspC N-terminal domain-containing protein n=2 Tax=Pseudonocardia eucalypti TaxID=648755 RepID=A0ABP9PUV7_9PSEU